MRENRSERKKEPQIPRLNHLKNSGEEVPPGPLMVPTALCMQAGINIAAAPFLSNEGKKLALTAPNETYVIFQRSRKKV